MSINFNNIIDIAADCTQVDGNTDTKASLWDAYTKGSITKELYQARIVRLLDAEAATKKSSFTNNWLCLDLKTMKIID